MSVAGGASIIGMDDLKRKLQSLGADLGRELVAAGKASMQRYVEREAKQKCVVDDGNLRASINTQEVTEGSETFIKTGTTVFYAPFIEYGTGIYNVHGEGRKTPWRWPVKGHKWPGIFGIEPGELSPLWYGSHPHPFLRPAFDEQIDNVIADVEKRLQSAISRYQA